LVIVPSTKPSFIFAWSAVFIERDHVRWFPPLSKAATRGVPGLSEELR
ncbi:hypothetical protein A2U01_0079756, partial [Trifolium medium]|nr:hypothetical protein [Trifolium medium]